MNARKELLTAVNAVLGGKRFIAASVNDFTDSKDEQTTDRSRSEVVPPHPSQNVSVTGSTESSFYSDKIDCRLHATPSFNKPSGGSGGPTQSCFSIAIR
jgi:hypothetical protein